MYAPSPQAAYHRDIEEKGFESDPSQQHAVAQLQDLYERLIAVQAHTPSLWLRLKALWSTPDLAPERGLYFWGGVGRGKTYLMDLFFDALPFEHKLRTHFHRFMRQTHRELRRVQNHKDPLELVAERYAEQYRVICFDEFFVVDITDAMILAGLLDGLFRRGVTLVATSNIAPHGLYENGLQRARFLPAIALIEGHTQVVNVDGGIDYRLRTLKQSALYYSPHDAQAEQALALMFDQLKPAAGCVDEGIDIEIEGRLIPVIKRAEGLVWCDFYALCDGPRSQNDYIELAREYHTVVVSNLPVFGEKNDDQARRFIYLVDEFYDRGVKLILSAAEHYLDLYQGGRLSFEFERTKSRLQEMQSEEYLSSPHRT